MTQTAIKQGSLGKDRTATMSLIPRDIPGFPRIGTAGLAAVAVLAIVFLVASFHRLNHTDLWGHLNFGRWIAEHGTLPSADPFRDVGFAARFVNQPWLSQWAGYHIFQFAGFDGLTLAHALLITATCGAVMLAFRARGLSGAWAVAGGVVSFGLSLPIIGTLRPQLCGELGFAVTLWGGTLLLRQRHPLVWLPIVFALWTNLHGSTPMGLLVLGSLWLTAVWGATRTLNWRDVVHDPRVRRLTLALVLCTLAVGCNPTGWRTLWDSATFANQPNLQAITEWQPLTIKSLTGILFFGSLAATAVVLRRSPRRLELFEAALLLLLAVATLSAIRMLAWWALAWPWLIGALAAAMFRSDHVSSGTALPARPTSFRTLVAIVVVFAALVWSPATHGLLTGHPRTEASAVNIHTPVYLAQALTTENVAGNIYAPLDWADYVVWKSQGAVRPLVHSHVHLASAAVFADYRRIAAGDAAWLDIVDHYHLKYLVLRNEQGQGLERLATSHRRCRVIYRDQQGLLVEILPPAPATADVSKSEHVVTEGVALFQQ